MTNPKLQKLRELNDARQPEFQNIVLAAFLFNNADWLIGCVEALEWYADPIIWKTVQPTGTPRDIRDFDGGRRARAALEGKHE